MHKLLIPFFALALCASPASGGDEAPYAPHNIQIVVETRQAGFQNQSGAQASSQSSQTQFVVVSEGLEGKIFLGESVP